MLTKARPRIRGTALALVPAPPVPTLSGGAQSDADNWRRVDTCLSHSREPSKLHFRCLGSHGAWGRGGGEAGAVGGDTTLTSNGTVPGLPGLVHPLQGTTIPTSPYKSHLHQVDCTSQYFTLKKKKNPLSNVPFFLVNRRYKKNTKSFSGCLPAKKSPNTEVDDSKGI